MPNHRIAARRAEKINPPAVLETLELRRLMSVAVAATAATIAPTPIAQPLLTAVPADGTLADGKTSPSGLGFTPSQIRSAYGIQNITLNGVTGTGAGQTIAIVTADDDPDLVSSSSSSFSTSDLAVFDAEYGLPNPTFTKIEQTTDGISPPANTGWAEEADLDVEYAHAIAPAASIDLIECQSAQATQLFDYGVATAEAIPSVSVISMSLGFSEFNGEAAYDHFFTTPSGHQGITFVAATGDAGSPGYYPAFSPNVVAVGGTSLTMSGANYSSESIYSSSGGGTSVYEGKPTYQDSVNSTSKRQMPDVAFDGNPNTGVSVYDSYNGGYAGKWYEIAGTSLSAPAWAGLIAVADQGRVAAGLGTLDGPSQTLPKLYSMGSSYYHPISGTTATGAGGYNLVTGLGSPIANKLVPELAGVPSGGSGSISGTVSKVSGGSTSGFSGITVYLDLNDSGTLTSSDPSAVTGSSGTFSLTGLVAGTYDLREVVPSGYTQTSPSSSPTVVTVGTGSAVSGENFTDTASGSTTTGTKLTGTIIGTSGSYENDGNTIAKAFDGSLSTFFDGPAANGNWAGLNLGGQYTISSIEYAPRSGWASRMVGGTFQGSNSSTFTSGVTNLATISSSPVTGSFTTVSVSSSSAFQYVRYLSPSGSYGDVAEIEFFGKASGSSPAHLTGSVIGTSGSYDNDGNTIANAFDGNLSTYFDGPTASGDWAGLSLGSASQITQISYAPRASFASRMVGGTFQASNSSTFTSGVVNLYTITAAPAYNALTTVNVSVSGTYKYVRYIGPTGSFGDVAEIDFYA